MQIRHSTPDRKQEGNYQLRATSHEQELRCCCQATTTLCLCLPPLPRNSQGQQWDSHSGVRVPVLHNTQQQNAALSAGCQLRRTGRLLTEFIGTSVRHYFDSLDKSHFSLQPQRLLICFLCNIILCQIVQTLNYRSILRKSFNIIKQKTAHSDRKYEEVK